MALEDLTPENRLERFLAGEDIEPATRLEYFLKQAGGSGYIEVIDGTIPSFNTLEAAVKSGVIPYLYDKFKDGDEFWNRVYELQQLRYVNNTYTAIFAAVESGGTMYLFYISPDRTSRMNND